MENVTIEDVKVIETRLGIELTNEQRVGILQQYQRVVMDKGESWNVIIEDLERLLKSIKGKT
jgi:hypothetical protein